VLLPQTASTMRSLPARARRRGVLRKASSAAQPGWWPNGGGAAAFRAPCFYFNEFHNLNTVCPTQGSHTKYFLVILLVWVYQQECLDKNILSVFVKNIRNITNVTPRTSAPVGAPRHPESPSGDMVVGRASFR
jgi:hypothetical protein